MKCNSETEPSVHHSRDELEEIFRAILVPLVQDLMEAHQFTHQNSQWAPSQPVIASSRQEFTGQYPEKTKDRSDFEACACGKGQGQEFVKCRTDMADRTSRLYMNFSSLELSEESRYL